MLKIYALALMAVLSIGNAMASTRQIISLPDGTTLVCFYFPSGFVDCQKL